MGPVRIILIGSLAALTAAGCGGGSSLGSRSGGSSSHASGAIGAKPAAPRKPPPPTYVRLLASARGTGATSGSVPGAKWRGQTAIWIERTAAGASVLSFNQRLLELRLHSGTEDAGAQGWRFGPSVLGSERARLAAAFNGGFRLSTGAGGFDSYGRVGVPLRDGLGSIVTYRDGTTDIGSWHREVPAPGRAVTSVRQNLDLLIDHGHASSQVSCEDCWGATLGGVAAPARAALGVTAAGRLIWVGGENFTVTQLADTLLAQHAVRAVELDINPEWVAAYLYAHHGGNRLTPVPVVAGQSGIPGQFLEPWSRDFFTVVTR